MSAAASLITNPDFKIILTFMTLCLRILKLHMLRKVPAWSVTWSASVAIAGTLEAKLTEVLSCLWHHIALTLRLPVWHSS